MQGKSKEYRLLVYLSAFTGFFFLNLEFLLGRYYSRFFGNSAISWCLLISVLVIGFSIGQYLASIRSNQGERFPVLRTIGILYLFVGFFVFSILIARPCISWIATRNLPPSILFEFICYLIFLFPISVQIGAIGFLIYQRAVQISLEPVRTISQMIQVGALGSASACLWHVITLLLIEHFNTNYQILSMAILPILVAGICLQKKRMSVAASILVFGAGIFLDHILLVGSIFHLESAYANYRIYDEHLDNGNSLRYIMPNYQNLVACVMRFDAKGTLQESSFGPSILARYAMSRVRSPRKILVIGGGEGCQSQQLAQDAAKRGIQLDFDLLDIDSNLKNISELFFNPLKLQNHYIFEDARRWLGSSNNHYDLILVDAFIIGMVPSHLLTLEFYELLQRHLNSGGAIMANVIGRFDPNSAAFSGSTHLVAKTINGFRYGHETLHFELFSSANAEQANTTKVSNYFMILSSDASERIPNYFNPNIQSYLDRSRVRVPSESLMQNFGFFSDDTNNSDLLFRI